MIYMDNAATSIHKKPQVAKAMTDALTHLGNAGRGVNEASLAAMHNVFAVRSQLAGLFHAEDASRIAFTSNATESLNIAIKGLLEPGDHVVTTVTEHNSVLRPLYEMQAMGVEVTFIDCDSQGRILPEEIEAALRPDTKAIICTHAANVTGNVTDLDSIGKIAWEKGILLIVDAAQTAGTFEIDVQKTGIDVLCFTGHKSLGGPQGIGGIYVREDLRIRPLKSGGSGIHTYEKKHPSVMPTALEAGTLNGPGIAGLGAAIRYLTTKEMAKKRQTEQALTKYFYEKVSRIPGIRVYGDFTDWNRAPIVALNLEGLDSAEIGDRLFNHYGIAVRTGAHCAPLMHQALGTVETGAVRFSLSENNTTTEIDSAADALWEIANG